MKTLMKGQGGGGGALQTSLTLGIGKGLSAPSWPSPRPKASRRIKGSLQSKKKISLPKVTRDKFDAEAQRGRSVLPLHMQVDSPRRVTCVLGCGTRGVPENIVGR